MIIHKQEEMVFMKKKWIYGIVSVCLLLLSGCSEALPKPTVIEGAWARFEIDKNINVSTIDRYLNRSDTVYRDMRMLVDPIDYAALGGDAYLSGYIKGFSVVPYPFISDKQLGLPPELGEGYPGPTLFSYQDGQHVANYQESMQILEDLFPKDKNIFVICGAGGYALAMKYMLIDLGWNGDKIWNVGCYWSYLGENNVQIKRTNAQEQTYYAFYEVAYHYIDFNELNPV